MFHEIWVIGTRIQRIGNSTQSFKIDLDDPKFNLLAAFSSIRPVCWLLDNFVTVRLKLFEAFIEAGPQMTFQVFVVLINGLTKTQLITICTSAITLAWSASEFFLLYPTKVRTKRSGRPELRNSLEIWLHLHFSK